MAVSQWNFSKGYGMYLSVTTTILCSVPKRLETSRGTSRLFRTRPRSSTYPGNSSRFYDPYFVEARLRERHVISGSPLPRPWDLSAHKFDEGNMRLSTNEASGVLTLDAWPERRTATLSCAPSFDYLLIVYFRQHNSHRARPCRCPRFPRPPGSPFENDRERKAPPRRNDSVRPLSSQNAPLLMVKHRNSPVTRSSTCARPLLSSHKARPYSLALSS